jgi:wyosine [tRNA(Phe)-imidazoG37] synthetase (radical SAM superfamily)
VLSTTDHRRDRAGLTYVYPVLSRRAGGLSIGINLNPNNACNWRCVYCQVPNLVRGSAPDIELDQLDGELRGFLEDVVHGDFLERSGLPEGSRRICDIAISGNGEPTSARRFDEIVALIARIIREFALAQRIKWVLITNGSLIHRPGVQRGLTAMASANGEVWFKLDSITPAGMERINGISCSPERVRRNLILAAGLCPTWLQTCVFNWDGQPPSEAERQAYLDFLTELGVARVPLRGVLLYGLARPSLQPEAARLSALPPEWLEHYAERIRRVGLEVKVSA